jgi:hypothetical protein
MIESDHNHDHSKGGHIHQAECNKCDDKNLF